MTVIWESKKLTLHDLGQRLHLDLGTLTPVIKKLVADGYICKYRDTTDEHLVMIELTPEGDKLKDRALEIPHLMACKLLEGGLHMTAEEVEDMKKKLYAIIHALQ